MQWANVSSRHMHNTMFNFFKNKHSACSPNLDLQFHAESDLADLSGAIAEYQGIWESDGCRIMAALRKFSGLEFEEDFINVLVCNQRKSQSHPLLLGADLDLDGKRCTLMHELGHRIMYKKRNLNHVHDVKDSFETHVHLNLFLYDAWAEVYGKEFADKSVAMEKRIVPVDDRVYGPAWDKVLPMSLSDRQSEIRKIFSHA